MDNKEMTNILKTNFKEIDHINYMSGSINIITDIPSVIYSLIQYGSYTKNYASKTNLNNIFETFQKRYNDHKRAYLLFEAVL